MEKITIRQASHRDLPTLLEFEQFIIEYERPFEEQMKDEHFNYYDLAELIESDNAQVLVAECNSEIVASGYAKIKASRHYLADPLHAFLGFMFVRPEYRGKSLNQKIIEQLIEWSKAKGMKSVSLTVFADNKSAIKAYHKAGFNKQLIEMRKLIDQ